MQFTDLQLRQYLLENLDEKASAEIGEKVISDEAFEERVLIAEDELFENFLEKNLTPEEENLFHENFLISADRKKRFNEIYLFKRYAKRHVPAEIPVRAESLLQKIKNLDIRLRFAAPALAALLIAVAIVSYFFSTRTDLSPLENEYAKLNGQDFSDSKKFSQFTAVNLISDTYRTNGDSKKLKTENFSDKVFFRLALLFNLPENESLDAEVIKDQKTIFKLPDIRVYQNQNGQEFRLLLPGKIFSRGAYQIKIENPETENSPITYDFVVE